jgi:feruloyl esterase
MLRALFVLLAATATPALAGDCAALRGLAIPGAVVTDAAVVTGLDGGIVLKAPACRVLVTARPSADSDIRIAVIIPEGDAWNGKFAQVGNGGFAGRIGWGQMALGLARGYAVAATDDGHQDADAASAKWALGHPEKIVDFGWRAVKTTTDVANAVLAAHGSNPKHRYFVGCSDGGREALMTAQRYPGDFDGIVAGAPAWPWTRMLGNLGKVVRLQLMPGNALPPAKLPAMQAAALAACGNGLPYIADPRACRFDPGVLACKGAETDACLTPGQLQTARLIYGGRRDVITGKPFPGLKPGAEALPQSWADWRRATVSGDTKDANSSGYAWSFMAHMVKDDPNFDLRTITDADIRAGHRRWAATLDADNPDLSAFRDGGGKLISFHGWNDPAIPPQLSIDYRDMVRQKTRGTDGFYRLFMVPGMLHCNGGNAPVNVDWYQQIDQWVEGGPAPATVTARNAGGKSQVITAER